MDCPSCGSGMAEVTIGSGEDALTMGSCDRCSKRFWHQHGEVIDLREALGAIGTVAASPAKRSQPAARPAPPPIGTTTALELLRAGLAPRHIVPALMKELALDERGARAALAAAERSELTYT